jgi:Protein of unknown function (DUF3618)
MVEEPDRIRNDIDDTRSDLARRVDLLADKTIPTRVAHRRWSAVKEKVMGSPAPRHGTHSAGEGGSAVDSVRDGARSAVATAQDKASQVGDSVQDAPAAVARQTQGNPIAAGVIAFGVGLLAASLIPATEVEKRAGAQLKDNAGGLVDQVREPLQESAQQLKSDLTGTVKDASESVKATAQDAAHTTAREAKSSTRDATEQTRAAARNAT